MVSALNPPHPAPHAPRLTVRPLARMSRLSPGSALPPPSRPKGRRARRSDRMPAVMGRRASTWEQQAQSARNGSEGRWQDVKAVFGIVTFAVQSPASATTPARVGQWTHLANDSVPAPPAALPARARPQPEGVQHHGVPAGGRVCGTSNGTVTKLVGYLHGGKAAAKGPHGQASKANAEW